MTFGITTWKADGTAIMTPNGAGGVYVELWSQAAGAPAVRTYTNLLGMSLRVFQVSAGSFTWAIGVDGSGYPTITFTALPDTINGGPATLLVFAT